VAPDPRFWVATGAYNVPMNFSWVNGTMYTVRAHGCRWHEGPLRMTPAPTWRVILARSCSFRERAEARHGRRSRAHSERR